MGTGRTRNPSDSIILLWRRSLGSLLESLATEPDIQSASVFWMAGAIPDTKPPLVRRAFGSPPAALALNDKGPRLDTTTSCDQSTPEG